MDKQRLTLAALTLLPLAAACGTENAASDAVGAGSSVTGVHWAVDDLTVDGRTTEAPGTAYLRIADDGKVRGNLGCNNFGAEAGFDDGRVSFDGMSATEIACQGVPVTFEETLARTLSDGDLTARMKGDQLTLTTADGDRIRLTKETDAPLYGTKWLITSPDTDGRAHLTFDQKSGKVSGSLGCNEVNARATVRDGQITLGTAATTRMMCDTSLMKSEKSLLRLFDGTVSYVIDHRTLTLTSENADSVGAVADK
ncbi:META domain-containing protein [Streptomyces luteolifulvus]|jgi:heat shock protein HslJ|uniref:META domain-containing protein n=1 Tax=Streptomyces luteolifulvus TaxID=2615112 RepID=A0A6H9V6K5_9ACTN|nr:META domain-containing protein [Streptomyces luteolifulvus]KAB1149157.1 META domain-containing protein [Streptomyces luteolifulvus]